MLVEKTDHLGGNLARVDLTAPYLDSARDILTEAHHARASRARQHHGPADEPQSAARGFVGNFKATLGGSERDGRRRRQGGCGNVSWPPATRSSTPADHALRLRQAAQRHHLVRASSGCCARAASRPKERRGARSTSAIIHCVGSRDRGVPRLLLARLLHDGAQVRPRDQVSAVPTAYVSDVYIDMHAFGKGCEDFYKQSCRGQDDVLHVRQGRAPGHPQGRRPRTTATCSSR